MATPKHGGLGDMQRQIAMTFLVGAGIGLSGCQSPSLGGLSIWNRSNSSITSTSPDVGKQKFNGLSQQLADEPRSMGQSQKGTAAIGAGRPAESDGFLLASWKKTTAAVSGGMAAKPKLNVPVDQDPLRLDKMPRKIGPEVYIGAARLLENQGNYAEAETKYRDALRAAPNDLSALVGLARLFDRQGEGQKAIDAYHKAAQAHPTNGLVFNDLGLCYRRQQQLDKSLAAFRKAVELHPDNAKYRNNLAAALVDAGRGDEAYHELAALNSAAVAHYNLAYLLQQKGQRTDAARHLQEAVALDPALTPARDMLAQLGLAAADSAAVPAKNQPAPRIATHAPQAVSSYAAGATESSVYTSAPQVGSPMAEPSPSFHVGDDAAAPAVETAQRPSWSSAAWALPSSPEARSSHPLPPIE
jgi:Flp pilus assembly protein TadD